MGDQWCLLNQVSAAARCKLIKKYINCSFLLKGPIFVDILKNIYIYGISAKNHLNIFL